MFNKSVDTIKYVNFWFRLPLQLYICKSEYKFNISQTLEYQRTFHMFMYN